MKVHIDCVHYNIRNYKCQDCENAFFTRGSLNWHRYCAHKIGKQKFKCEQCSFSTFAKTYIKKHSAMVHEKIIRHFCEESGYGCYQKKDMDIHMISAHGKGDKKFKCKKCSYSAVSKHLLKRHNDAVHEKIKNHACSECDYAAYRKEHLKRHMESVHREGGKELKRE